MSENRKVLIISYDFFPDNSPNTYRWLNVIKEWERNNVEVFVVASKKIGVSFFDYEQLGNIKIYRVGGSLIDKFKQKLINSNEKKDSNIKSERKLDHPKKSFIKKLHDVTWKKIYFPDFAFLWQSPAYKIAEKIIKKEGIYNVITVSWPFSGHVVGARLKKKYDIHWVADTIDPFCLSNAVNNNFLYHRLNYIYENEILKTADIVSVLTEKLKEKYTSMFPSLKGKMVVNHNVFIPYSNSSRIPKKSNDKIKLVFVGTLTPITRSPENLLKFFVSLLEIENLKERLELYLYGDTNQCLEIINKYDFFINKNFFIKGFVPRESIPFILNEADVLVNIGNNNEFQEPSKILEYVFLGKPILNVCTIENDSSKEMLKEYPLNLNINPNEIEDPKKCAEVYDFLVKRKYVSTSLIDTILDKYLLKEVQKRYFEMLKNV